MEFEFVEKKTCTGWCWPLYIQIGIAILQIIFLSMLKEKDKKTGKVVNADAGTKIRFISLTLIWNILIGVLIYYLCKKCHHGWAWFIVLLPIFLNLLLLIVIIIAAFVSSKKIGPMPCKKPESVGFSCSNVGYCCGDDHICCPGGQCEGGVCVAVH